MQPQPQLLDSATVAKWILENTSRSGNSCVSINFMYKNRQWLDLARVLDVVNWPLAEILLPQWWICSAPWGVTKPLPAGQPAVSSRKGFLRQPILEANCSESTFFLKHLSSEVGVTVVPRGTAKHYQKLAGNTNLWAPPQTYRIKI